MVKYVRSERFFYIVALFNLAFVIAGFGSFAIVFDVALPPPLPVALHGAITIGWFALTAVQASLIANARFGLHKTLGGASLVLALALVASGYFVTSGAMARPDWSIAGMGPESSAIFPFFDLFFFTIFYALALVKRTKAPAHKRLMLFAGVLMFDPALARLGMAAGFEPLPAVISLGLCAAFLIYDWRSRGKPHWASVIGTLAVIGGTAIRFTLSGTDAWQDFARAIF